MPLPRGAYVAMIFALVLLGGVSVAGYNYFGSRPKGSMRA